MSTLPSRRNYVPAQPDSWKPLQALWRALRALFAPPQAHPTRTRTHSLRSGHAYEATAPIPAVIHTETPAEVWRARDQASEARRLLDRYLKGRPTSRRPCMASGMTSGAWERARKSLMRCGVINRKGQLVYYGRDARLRLDIYLDALEQRAYESDRYVSPS